MRRPHGVAHSSPAPNLRMMRPFAIATTVLVAIANAATSQRGNGISTKVCQNWDNHRFMLTNFSKLFRFLSVATSTIKASEALQVKQILIFWGMPTSGQISPKVVLTLQLKLECPTYSLDIKRETAVTMLSCQARQFHLLRDHILV
jgi:hypothetical protein